MKLALQKTYEAVPALNIVFAVVACAISGGCCVDHADTHHGADGAVPVDFYVPGFPPSRDTNLAGLLRLLGRLEEKT